MRILHSLMLTLAGCAPGGTVSDYREGGTNTNICIWALCNYQGTTQREEGEGDAKQKAKAKQDGAISPAP